MHGTVTETSDGVFVYKAASNFVGVDEFTYSLCDASESNCETATVRVTVSPVKTETKIQVEELLTPNGDGINDEWFIKELAQYVAKDKSNSITIFTETGKRVFEKKNYMFDTELFKGYSNIGGSSKLPSGIYFYVIDVSGEKRITGYIYLLYK